MKKKIFGAILVVAIAAGAMINVNLNKASNKGNLALANVEALAQSEGDYGTAGSIVTSNTQTVEYTCFGDFDNKQTTTVSVTSCPGSGTVMCIPNTSTGTTNFTSSCTHK